MQIARIPLALLLFVSLAAAETLEDSVDAYLVAAEATPQKFWNIDGSAGVVVTGGNSESGTATARLTAERQGPVWRLLLEARLLYAATREDVETSPGVFETRTNESAWRQVAIQRLERKLGDDGKHSFFEEIVFEHDEQEKIDWRFTGVVGYRHQFTKTENFEFYGELGAGATSQYSRATNPDTNERFGESTHPIAQAAIDFTWQMTKTLSYVQRVAWYPHLDDGEYRLVAEALFSNAISDTLSAELGIIDRYNSDPQGDGIKNNDVVVALSLKFVLAKRPEK